MSFSSVVEHVWDAQTGLHKLSQETIDKAICKGFLRKQGANWKTWRNRFFVLTVDVLYYLPSAKADIPLGAILLSQMVIEGSDDTVDKPWCFLVKPKKSWTGMVQWSSRTYYLQATDYVDMNKWIDALQSFPMRHSKHITYRPSMNAKLYQQQISSSPTPSTNLSTPSTPSSHTPPPHTKTKLQHDQRKSEFYTENSGIASSSSEDEDEDGLDSEEEQNSPSSFGILPDVQI